MRRRSAQNNENRRRGRNRKSSVSAKPAAAHHPRATEEAPRELSEIEEETETIEESELLSGEELGDIAAAASESEGEAPGGYEHEYELHEATGGEGGTPDRTLEFAPRDHVPDLETLSVAPDELGHFYLERAVQDSRATEEGEPMNPDDEERIKPGERAMMRNQPGQAVQVGGLAVRLPDRTEVEEELSEKAERIAQRSRKAAAEGASLDEEDEKDPTEPISRAVVWRTAHERERKPRPVKKSPRPKASRRPASR
jgi:hypothetical protein